MNVVVICNGLGNQMSQYAFYLRKKDADKSTRFIFDNRSSSTHNGYELQRIFGIDYKETLANKLLFYIFRFLSIERMPAISKPIFKLLNVIGIRLVNENPNYDFDEQVLKTRFGLTFYYGGWHSEKYFSDVKDQVLDAFQFKDISDDFRSKKLISEINNKNSVSIHVRRGDFLSEVNKNTFGAVCTKEYFIAAINKISSIVDDPYFYVFSNDIQWVNDNLICENLTIVDFNKGQDSWKDMYLMSICKHNLNSNSTFSWWAAWLNENNGKVIVAPKYFINNLLTKDFYPNEWLKISDY